MTFEAALPLSPLSGSNPSFAEPLEPVGKVDSPSVNGNSITPQTLTTPEGSDEHQALTRQLQQQIQLIALINQINNEIRRTLDLDEVLNTACRLLAQALECSRVSVVVSDPEDPSIMVTQGEYNQSSFPNQLGLKVPLEDNAYLQTVICQPGVLPVNRFLEFPELGEQTQELAQFLGIRSVLALATRYQGQVNGVIEIQQCDRDREWNTAEQQLLEEVGSQLAIAINQSRLYTESRRQAERESLLRLVVNQIHSTLDLSSILQTAVREVRKLLDTDRVVIYQFVNDSWHGQVVVEEVVKPWDSVLNQMSTDTCFSQSYANFYQKGRVRAIDDIWHSGLDPCHAQFLHRLQVKANLIVPIIISSNLWGLLVAHECRDIRHWRLWEAQFLQQLADEVAIAIQQAELYAQIQASATQSQAQAEQLQATLQELQTTQMQLIQNEKLSSLGQMVAGIAHEINNAINFIHANLPYAQDYAQALNEAIQLYQAACPQAPEGLDTLSDDLELEFIQQDFPKILESMQEGSKRIREIVLTLRNFSRLDEAAFKPVNLHEGLDSTLMVLQHRMQAGVTLHKHYGDLPLVECQARQLNQVFLNILTNALDAVGDRGEITIKTWQSSPDHVTLSIQDTGPGIPLEIQKRIFDPFFTTKAVGEGKGLGLSICHQIVVQGHSGQIRCISQPKEGTEFHIELPIVAAQEQP